MYEALEKYGDRINQIGLFSFKVRATGEIYETGVAISDMMPYIQQWPHIRWLLTVANDGYNPIFKAIRENTNGAQDMFLSELIRIMQKYPGAMEWILTLKVVEIIPQRRSPQQCFRISIMP